MGAGSSIVIILAAENPAVIGSIMKQESKSSISIATIMKSVLNAKREEIRRSNKGV